MIDFTLGICCLSRDFPADWVTSDACAVVFQLCQWIRHCSVDGQKRYENDKCGHKSFLKRNKTAPSSFENGLVWTGPDHQLVSKLKGFQISMYIFQVLLLFFNLVNFLHPRENQVKFTVHLNYSVDHIVTTSAAFIEFIIFGL